MTALRVIAPTIALALALALSLSGCAQPGSGASREVSPYGEAGKAGRAERGPITEAELQQDLQRFASIFGDRSAQVISKFRGAKDSKFREEGLRLTLGYVSSVLEIATSPLPELGLLDLLVFVTLNRMVYDEYWLPKVFSARDGSAPGEALGEMLRRSEPEAWAIADKVMSASDQAEVRRLIHQWRAENPDQVRVAGVRLKDFSRFAGKVAEERSETSRGILKRLNSALEKADEAMLLTNRALYLAQRMPFLIRIQADVGASEIFSDLEARLGSLEGFEAGAGSLLSRSTSLVEKSGLAAREARLFAESLSPLVFSMKGQISSDLAAADRIAGNSLSILQQLNQASPSAIERVDRLMMRGALYLLALGAALVALWWIGYYLVKRAQLRAYSRLYPPEQDRLRELLPPPRRSASPRARFPAKRG